MTNFVCARCGQTIEIGSDYFRDKDGLGYCVECEKPISDDKMFALMRELADITDNECPGKGTEIFNEFEQKWME